MIVVANATPLIGLSKVGLLKLLKELYEEIYVAESVYKEVVIKGSEKSGAEDVKKAKWIKKESVKNMAIVRALEVELGPGEAQTITLSIQLLANLTILDELLAREVAKYMGLQVKGTLGILSEAKRKGLIKKIRPYMDELKRVDFWIDDELYNHVLRKEGEN